MSTDDQPPAKRKRAYDSSPEPEECFTSRDVIRSDIWYEDGNIILQAERTQFKVYRGVLARSSPFFESMFSLPQPPSSEVDLIEGCLIVHLHDDSAEEVRHVLRALCPQESVTFREKLPLTIISAYLCLGKKYEIKHLHVEARRRLFEDFHTTLTAYTSRPHWSVIIPPEYGFLEVLLLAHRAELLSIVPYVLYCCCKNYSAKQLVGGVKKTDGTVLSFPPEYQLACLAGHRAIINAQADTTYGWLNSLNPLSEDCTTPKSCRAACQGYIHTAFPRHPKVSALIKWKTATASGGDLCRVCAEAARLKHDAGRAEFWERLPSLFNLPPWSRLREKPEDV